MLRLALSTLRTRKPAFVGAFVALFFAATLVSACGMLLETGLRGGIPTERYAGSPIVVAGRQDATTTKHVNGKTKTKAKPLAEHAWIPASVVDAVRSVSGVQDAIPELTFPAAVMVDGRPVNGSAHRLALGHGWGSAPITPFALRTGRAPARTGEVVIDADLAARAHARRDTSLTIQTTSGARDYRVVGVAAPRGRAGLERESTIFLSDQEARRLAGHSGQVGAIGVRVTAGGRTDVVRRHLERALTGPTARVYTGDERGPLELLDAARARVKLISLSGTLSAISVLVAVLVVALTFGLSIQQRSRELALLRAIAATPRQVRRMISREALVVGLVAGVAGCVISRPFASWLRDRFVAAGAIPDVLHLSISPFPMIVSLVVTASAAVLAARIAARRVSRVRPAEALTEAAIKPPRPAAIRLTAGLVLGAGGTILTVVLSGLRTEAAATPVTFLTTLVWVSAAALLGPVLVRGATAALGLPLRILSPVGGYFAAAYTQANTRRVTAVAIPLALAVAFSCTILFSATTLDHSAAQQARDGTAAQYVLQSSGPGIAPADVDALRRIAGIDTVTEVLHTEVRGLGLEKYRVQGVTPEHLRRTLDLDVRAGSVRDRGNDTVAVSDTVASGSGIHIGDRMRLRMGDGTLVPLRVIAIYARGLGFGDLTLPHDLVAAHVDVPLDDTVLITTTPGGPDPRPALAARVRALPGVRLTGPAALLTGQAAERRANSNVALLLMGLVIAFTAIAAVNALAMATADRSPELALLRLVGTTRRQLRRMIHWESAVVATIAAGLGTLISSITLRAFSEGMTRSPTPDIPVSTYGLVIAGAVVLTWLTADLAARFALRADPAESINAAG